MIESKIENLNLQDNNEKAKIDKILSNLKVKLYNLQCLGLKYYMSSTSYEVITIIISLFQLLSYSFFEIVKYIILKLKLFYLV